MSKEDGGPAFPGEPKHIVALKDGSVTMVGYSGISIRDYFAAQALVGLIGSRTTMDIWAENTAANAYGLADAMLAERSKP